NWVQPECRPRPERGPRGALGRQCDINPTKKKKKRNTTTQNERPPWQRRRSPWLRWRSPPRSRSTTRHHLTVRVALLLLTGYRMPAYHTKRLLVSEITAPLHAKRALETHPETYPKSLSVPVRFLAGGVAGVAEIIAMYPLDGWRISLLFDIASPLGGVVKTRQQLEAGKSTSTFATLGRMIKDEGVARMYRGGTAPVLVEAPKRATKFAANEQYKELIKSFTGAKEITRPQSVLAGAMAGITEATLIVPFELVKVRLQDKASVGLYKGPGDVVKHIMKHDGLTGLYKGWEATCWRHGLWTGSYFGVIASVRAILPSEDQMPGGELAKNFAAGTIGGAIGTLCNTPADVVKSRIQNQPTVPGQPPKYGWTVSPIILSLPFCPRFLPYRSPDNPVLDFRDAFDQVGCHLGRCPGRGLRSAVQRFYAQGPQARPGRRNPAARVRGPHGFYQERTSLKTWGTRDDGFCRRRPRPGRYANS
ncbi:MAG: mitochondrial carrier domain-containing protein, partial [Olpidium bornovanus]